MGTERAAAVNLLSMTRPQGSLRHYAGTAPQHQTLPTHAQVNAACLPDCDAGGPIKPGSVSGDLYSHLASYGLECLVLLHTRSDSCALYARQHAGTDFLVPFCRQSSSSVQMRMYQI